MKYPTQIPKSQLELNVPDGYRMTNLGLAPEDWSIVRLGSWFQSFKSGNGITSEQISETGEYPVYGGNGLRGYGSDYSHEGEFVLIGRQGALCGNVLRASGRIYVSEHAIAGKTTSENDIDFIAHYLEHRNLNRLSESSAQPGLSVHKLSMIKVVSPPLSEQRTIADCLSTWDHAIEKLTQLIELKEQRKKGLMQQLLTGKKRLPAFAEASADKPGYSGEWVKIGAGLVFKSVTKKGFTDEVLLSATQDRGMIPRTDLEGRVTMPSSGTTGFKLVEKGDFVISLRSFQGGLEYSGYRGLVSPAYTVLKPKEEIDKEFYKQYFKTYDFIGHLAIAVIGIRDGKQISYDDFCSVKVPFPQLEEQKAISKELRKADQEIELLQNQLDQLHDQKKGMMQQLLTGKKRLNLKE